MSSVARPAEHHVVSIDFPRKHDAIAVIRQIGVLKLVIGFEVLRPPDADRRAVISVAPGHIISVVNPADARVVTILPGRYFRRVALEPDWLCIDMPIDRIFTSPGIKTHPPLFVITAEYPGKRPLKRHGRTVENAVGSGREVAGNNRVSAISPNRIR